MSDDMFNMDQVKEMLLKHEGLRLYPYHCSEDKLTIGIGRNIQDRGITEDEAKYLLANDINEVTEQLDKVWAAWRTFPVKAQYVCIDMAFQLGVEGFMKFRQSRQLMEEGMWTEASEEILRSKWARQTPNRANYNSRQLYLCQNKAETNKTTHTK